MSEEDFDEMLKSALERAEKGEGKSLKDTFGAVRENNK
jgi:hypothetical protein